MGKGLPDQPLTREQLDQSFGPAEPIEDELLASASDVPLVEPNARSRSAGAQAVHSAGLTKALWFFGIVVTALLVLQTAQVLLPRFAPLGPTTETPSAPTAHDDANHAASESITRTLNEARLHLSRSLYQDVLRVLEPVVAKPELLDPYQRFDAYLLLARAYRELNDIEKAQTWSLRAMDQAVERRGAAQIVEYASTLASSGQHEEARRALFQILARSDGLAPKEMPYARVAEARIADAWYAQAQATGKLPPLPASTKNRGNER